MKSKRIISTLLVVVMVVMVCSTAAFADTPWLYECTGDGVNVRNGPSVYADSYGYLNSGETFGSMVDSGDYGSFRYGFCTPSTAISQAYGYIVQGYVNQLYLKKCIAS